MKVLLITKNAVSLTGAGTYEENLIIELSKRHTVEICKPDTDIRNGHWDIAHCTDLKHLSLSLAKKLPCPLVVDAHDYYWVKFFRFFSPDLPIRFLLQKYRLLKYHFLFKYIDGMILHGRFVYNAYNHPNKYLNFYYGLEYSSIVKSNWDKKENIILFVGGDFFRKGLPRLIRSMPSVIKKVPDAKLFVIGNDYWYARLFTRFMSRSLPVEFVYGMPKNELYRTYSRAKVLVMPAEIEAIPLVSSEATMAGVPPILSDAGGNPEIVLDGKTGFIASLSEPSVLAERIIRCLTDKTLSENLVSAGTEYLSQFTIEKMIGRLDEIYTDIISKRILNG